MITVKVGQIPLAEAERAIMLPSEMMIWQPGHTHKTLSRKLGAVQYHNVITECTVYLYIKLNPNRLSNIITARQNFA